MSLLGSFRFLALAVVCAAHLYSQSFTGSILGTVKDSSGAVIPDAQVQVTNVATNLRTAIRTDASGGYVATLLQPGRYTLEVSAPGFKRFVQDGIVIQVQQQALVDVTLSVGELAESVVVTAEAAQLETASATLGKVVDNKAIVNLPLNTRNVYSLVFLTPGVTGTVGNSYGDMRYSVNGARQRTMDTLIDGVTAAHPTVNGFAGISVFPSVDAIEEFKVMGANYPAEFGRSLGSVLNVVFKSGSNQFHGSAYEFLRNSVLDANNFFDNLRGQELASFKRSQFGGVLSGPVLREKTFFMVSFEALRERSFQTRVTTVPTLLERQGDFTETRASSGQQIRIFDPFSTMPNPAGSGFVRTQFANNRIPSSMFDPVAINVMKYYPAPNTVSNAVTNQNNYAASGSRQRNVTQSDYRIDQVISPAQRFFARYSTRLNESVPAILFPSELAIAEGRINEEDHVHGGVVDYTHTLSPTTILSARLGLARTHYIFSNQGLGFVPSSLGLPQNIDLAVDRVMFPGFSASGYTGLGGGDHRSNAFMTYTLASSLTKVMGRHTMKIGTDIRLMRVNVFEARSAGSFGFSAGMTQGPNPNTASSTAGNGFASLLLGTGSSNNNLIQNFKNVATQSFYYAGYFQDDWRLSPTLTLNLGLRWDIDAPRTERYNRTNYFDPLAASPVSSVVPNARGGLVFVGVGGIPRTQFPADTNNWAPRFGLSWQAARRTVVRAGYAHIYGPSQQAAAGTIGTLGFRVDNLWVNSIDGITPHNLLRNPYPGGFPGASGSSLGVLTQFGAAIEATTQDLITGWSRQMNFNVQQELPANMLVEVAYVGTRGFHLHRNSESGLNLNQLDPVHLALGSRLNDQVDNPFYGHFSGGILSTPRVSRGQLLRPYPQFTNIVPIYSVGASSFYHSMQITGRKRFSHGLQFEGSYTWAKNIDDGMSHQNSYNIRADRALSDIDVAHRFVMGFVYELPFGRGRRFGGDWSRALDLVGGGWQVNGITSYQSGTPIAISASNTAGLFNPATRPNNNGASGRKSGPVHERLNAYFDKSVFSQPAAFTFGNLSARVPDIRNDIERNWDLSVFKDFQIVERLRLQFRAEALNAFNTPRFGGPNTSVTSSAFGVITSQANAPRQIQFGAKLLW